jgi:hypothetical protein
MKTQNCKMVGQKNRIKNKKIHKNNKAKIYSYLVRMYKLPFVLATY